MGFKTTLFVDTVNMLEGGRAAEDLSKELSELIAACRDTEKGGSLSLKITVKPDRNRDKDYGQYFLAYSVENKKPKFDKAQTIAWGTPEGNLMRTDPRQTELPLRAVEERREVKAIEEPKAPVKTIQE